MGLPKFWAGWLKRYKELFLALISGRVSGLSIDGNGILYGVAAAIYNQGESYTDSRQAEVVALLQTQQGREQLEEQFFTGLFALIEEILNAFNPQDYLLYTYDELAPAAKQTHQRQRRFRSAIESGPGKENFNASAQFSPGTDMMQKIGKRTGEFLEQKWYESWATGPRAGIAELASFPRRLIYSGNGVPGEGEHKIMAVFRAGLTVGEYAHVVYGMDADLSVLCLGLKKSQLFLARRHKSKKQNLEILPIDTLRSQIVEELRTDSIDDFVGLTTLIGNDFFPAIPGLGIVPKNMEVLTDCYRQMQYRLVSNGELQLAGFRELLLLLSRQEQRIYSNLAEYKQHPFVTNRALTVESFTQAPRYVGEVPVPEVRVSVNIPLFRKLWYQQWGVGDIIYPQEEGSRYGHLLPGAAEEVVVGAGRPLADSIGPLADAIPPGIRNQMLSAESWTDEICRDFVRIMRWMIRYYLVGQSSVNWNVIYPHFRAPLVSDLLAYVETLPEWPDNIHAQAEATRMQTWQQLVGILPRRDTMPAWLRAPAQAHLPDLYAGSYPVTSEGVPDFISQYQSVTPVAVTPAPKRYPDQSVVLISTLNPDRIVAATSSIRPPDPSRYLEGTILLRDFDDPETQQKIRSRFIIQAVTNPKILRNITVGGPRPPRPEAAARGKQEAPPSTGAARPGKQEAEPPTGAARPGDQIIGTLSDVTSLQEYSRWVGFYKVSEDLLRQIQKDDKARRRALREIIAKHSIYLNNGFDPITSLKKAQEEVVREKLRVNYQFQDPLALIRPGPVPSDVTLEIHLTDPGQDKNYQISVIPVRPGAERDRLPFFRHWISREEWFRLNGTEGPEIEPKAKNPDLPRLIPMLLRNATIFPGSSPHLSLTQEAFTVLAQKGITKQCFAAPGQIRATEFYSLFPEVDAPFGSMGNFFNATVPSGLYECHPPPYPEIAEFTMKKLYSLVSGPDGYGFVCLLPKGEWGHPGIVARVILEPNNHVLVDSEGRRQVQRVQNQLIFLTNRQVPWVQELMTSLRETLRVIDAR